MAAKVYTEAELNLREFQFELKTFEKEVKDLTAEFARTRKSITKDVERAEKAVAKEKATKGNK